MRRPLERGQHLAENSPTIKTSGAMPMYGTVALIVCWHSPTMKTSGAMYGTFPLIVCWHSPTMKTSGAMYGTVPLIVCWPSRFSQNRFPSCLEQPKSAIFSKPSWVSKRFAFFRSRWITPSWWRYCTPSSSWLVYFMVNRSSKAPKSASCCFMEPPARYLRGGEIRP